METFINLVTIILYDLKQSLRSEGSFSIQFRSEV